MWAAVADLPLLWQVTGGALAGALTASDALAVDAMKVGRAQPVAAHREMKANSL